MLQNFKVNTYKLLYNVKTCSVMAYVFRGLDSQTRLADWTHKLS